MTVYNFSAGPAILPKPVLEKVQAELLNYQSCGCSVLEMSHRSPEFEGILNKAEQDFRKILSIPSDYAVLFMQGGCSTQFSAIVYNLVVDLDKPVDYIVTGAWSKKAKEEAARLGLKVNATTKEALEFSKDPSFIYYCDNETVHGVEMPVDFVDKLPKNIPIVCDMSSNFMSRPFDVTKYSVIIGGAQKNIGPAGLTIVIVKKDLLGRFAQCPLKGPLMLDYKLMADQGSMYNTPPTFAIYVSGLCFEWVLAIGGIEKIAALNKAKSQVLYEGLQKYPNVFSFPVEEAYRSRMNVPFRILKDGKPNEELEKDFIKGAEKLGMICLAGHRSVGGIRASLYNALPIEAVEFLVQYAHSFALKQ
ncbi:hypothetical protein HDV04_004503 [Boothiomyces sp. JEL0838]|nr:hypothetical protein HDV04_004503 [Boothiomyces sp. JEL0838]